MDAVTIGAGGGVIAAGEDGLPVYTLRIDRVDVGVTPGTHLRADGGAAGQRFVRDLVGQALNLVSGVTVGAGGGVFDAARHQRDVQIVARLVVFVGVTAGARRR